jgi:hypothetical protein
MAKRGRENGAETKSVRGGQPLRVDSGGVSSSSSLSSSLPPS